MFTLSTSSVENRALAEREAASERSAGIAKGRARSASRAAVALAIGGGLLASAIGAAPALADQYPPGSPYGTQYGVVASDSVPKGQVDTLINTDTGLVADAPTTARGTQTIQSSAGGDDNQNWVVVPSGAYDQIQNRQNGLCLDVSGGVTQNAPVIQSSCASVVSQQWKLVTQSGGVSIVNASSGGYLAVDGGENQVAPADGAGLVQDVDHKNHANVWKLSSASYRILTDEELATGRGANDPPSFYYVSTQYDAIHWTCLSGYHFRMASAGTYDSAGNHWVTLPQAAIDQAETPEVGVDPIDNLISTQQALDGGWFPSTGYGAGQRDSAISQAISWTNSTVASAGGNGVSDPNPAGANAGNGTVDIDYGYTTAFQGQDLAGQVILHCDPNG